MQNVGNPSDVAPASAPPGQSGGGRSDPSPPPGSRWWDNRLEALGWILLVGLLVGFFPVALRRLTRSTSSDFWLFYDSARYLWEYGARAPKSKFLYYLPSVDVAFTPLAWLSLRWAAVAWVGLMTAGWLFLLAAVRRYLLWDYDGTQARRSVLCAALLVMPLFLDHLCVGAFHVLMVWLMVAGLGRISRNKPWSGAMVLGLAVWIKLLPLVGVGYLLLKRKWLPAALALATALVVDLVLSLAAYGPEATWQSHCEWWYLQAFGARPVVDRSDSAGPRPHHESIGGGCDASLVDAHGPRDRGRSLPCATPHRRGGKRNRNQEFKPGWVGSVKYGLPRPNVSLADLTPEQLQVAYMAVMLLLVLGVATYCRRPGRELLPRRWSTEIALIVLSTLWFSPLVWSYHPTAALPALAVIFTRAPQQPRLAQAVAALWLVSLLLMASPMARVLGVTLWTNLLLGVFLLWTARVEGLPVVAAGRGEGG